MTTVATHDLLSFIQDYVKKEDVDCIVVGKPTQMSGEASENAMRVNAFIEQLKKILPNMLIREYDERFTSVLAHRAMLEGGLKKSDRRNKALVDEISATIILQSYMESNR